ncbi:MAG: alpha/beta hydrolase [Clostridiales bacterium]|nr:alpha/beta hydrolase [Clostridiales bacterium]
MKILNDMVYAPGCALDVYLPEGEARAAFIYFHGGGLEAGDKNDALHFADYLTEKGIAVISPNYRMYPEARYPDFIEDAACAVRWTYDHLAAYGVSGGIFIGGSSAGGYLSMMLCFDSRYFAHCGLDPMMISGYVHDAGQPTCHFNVLRERGIDTRRVIVDESCALYHIGTQPDYPPMLFIVSDHDMENRYEQTVLTLSTLRHFGHEGKTRLKVMHGGHCHYVGRPGDGAPSPLGVMAGEFILSQLQPKGK